MQVTIVPCLKDNYAYVLLAPGSKRAVVVDPSEAEPVERALAELGVGLGAILSTHHHLDHVGGNSELVQRNPGTKVYGYVSDRGRIPEQTEFLENGATLVVEGLSFRALHIPGHTLGAVAYVGEGAAFTGDTLFAGGCGRLFEGTPAQMYESLNVTLAALPDSTLVYCGHEYTASNLRFAAHLEPDNEAITAKVARVADQRARGVATVPSTMAEEKATNPFMRCDSSAIVARVSNSLAADRSPAAILGAVRAAKDRF
ncbi:MAG TPA: hydroxyacylglutathione hydrolase [Polyangiaceae bacterium]|nr:hydroxyacylglutathione hydrolase [Polyangiaceae bacterium]